MLKARRLNFLQSQQSTSSQSNGTSSVLLSGTSLERGDSGGGPVRWSRRRVLLGWAVGDFWATRGDGNQSGGNVSLSDGSRSSSNGGSDDSDGGELHNE